MICYIGARLRLAWYATTGLVAATELPLKNSVIIAVREQKEKESYQMALQALKDHNRECELCHANTIG
jgi:hypothetical protein